MNIKNNQNLKYSKVPGGWIGPGDLYELDTKKMELISVIRENEKTLKLNLKVESGNKKTAYIRAVNSFGKADLDFLQKILIERCISLSYDEILNRNFQE